MKITLKGTLCEVLNSVRLLADSLGITLCEDGTEIAVSKCHEGFRASVHKDSAEISYNTLADFNRALAIVTDALRQGRELELSELPAFEGLGIMLDVSRGAVMKPEKVKDILRLIARMGYNQLMLYTEDIYEMKKYPYFGYLRGRYTEEELKDIDAYAETLGIEAIPCIQTLGHLASPLRWGEFGDMKESDAVLYIGEPKTLELVEEMIKTMSRCFKTKKIHIGMDEAHGVGLGRYLLEHGYRNRFELLSEHLNAVVEICRKYSLEPMMWSDMFFRLGSKINSYYDWDNQLPENIESMIPEGVAQVYWDYYNHSEALYDIMFSEHKKMNREIIFAGGVWVWSGPSVNNVQSVESTLPALRACKRQGVKQVLVTLWGDEGTECDMYESLYGLQMFSEYSYRGDCGMDTLDEMFRISTGFDAELFKLFDVDDFGLPTYAPEKATFEETESRIINISKQILYLNPLMGMFDKNYQGIDLKAHFGRIKDMLESVSVPDELRLLADSHKQLVRVLYLKCDLSPRIKEAYDKRDTAALSALCRELDVLEAEYARHSDLRLALWCSTNKAFGYELIMKRIASAKEAIRFSRARLESFIKGECEHLEELEAERLYYNGIERPFFLEYFSDRISMAGVPS